ncbi:MAG TPA: SH3 domain-containing protein, partial [Thermomicrobiales bacterium]|nr:SH3 domain-containing protein [Thermomicrobiales bacterium]
RFKAPSTADTGDDEGDGETSSGFTKGGSVYVNSSDVNLRDSPSLNGGQVTVLLYGQEMTIDGDAVDADEVTWWPVHITADDTISGWVSGEFLQAEPVE